MKFPFFFLLEESVRSFLWSPSRGCTFEHRPSTASAASEPHFHQSRPSQNHGDYPKIMCILPGTGARAPGPCSSPAALLHQSRAACQAAVPAESPWQRSSGVISVSCQFSEFLITPHEIQWVPNASLSHKPAQHQQQGKQVSSRYANTALWAGICWCYCTFIALLQLFI